MKTKQLILLGGVLVILLAIALTTSKLDTAKGNGGTTSKEFFPSFKTSEAGKVTIKKGAEFIQLKRSGDRWLVSGIAENNKPLADQSSAKGASKYLDQEYLADSAAVVSLLEKIVIMKRDQIISTKSEKHETFEVTTDKGTIVEVFTASNNSLGSVIIGKNGSDWNSCFIREKGSDKVYIVRDGVKYPFHTDETRWRDKTITKFNQGELKRFSLIKHDDKQKSSTITFEKGLVDTTTNSTSWNIVESNQVADTKKVSAVIGDLASMTTTDWQTDNSLSDEALGFVSPELTVTYELDSGTKGKILFGSPLKDNDSRRYLRVEGNKTTFVVYKGRFDELNKEVKDFLPDAKK